MKERLNRRRNVWISLTAALLSGLLVYGVYALQLRQIELEKTRLVVVPKQFVKPGTLVTADMVKLAPIVGSAYRTQMLTRLQDAVGQQTLVPLGENEPLLGWKLDRLRLMPGADEATFSIPKEYVLSMPGSIRAGDFVRVYVSGKEASSRLLDSEVVVASVRSSANMEVDDPKNPSLYAKADGDQEKLYASRRESNGVIDQLSLILTEREWLAIDEACRGKQLKLVIALGSATAASPG
ncbi:CpaB family protein [Paenibacillus cymbidii]|uniref:flagellar biosynthesis protein FlgA n=1 Tax=Paenibacillus cymbidii TaxID=1639034 RepID=UPI001F2B42BC|nr:flagellar biosynthesis protein FlgA [Paenibacillus cymbidii]